MRSLRLLSLGLVSTILLAGCGGPPDLPGPQAPSARVRHVVLFTLKDPAQAPELVATCARLGRLPGALLAAAGPRLETGRVEASGGWHVAFDVGFVDVAAYEAWRAHPEHQAVLETWKPRVAGLEVHDWTVAAP